MGFWVHPRSNMEKMMLMMMTIEHEESEDVDDDHDGEDDQIKYGENNVDDVDKMMTIATKRNMKNLNARRSMIIMNIIANVNEMMVIRIRG